MNIAYDITGLGGLAATHELLARGWTGYALTYLARHGHLIRVRQGWYALPGTDPTLLAAWRVGGRLTCVSGAQSLRLAAPSDPLIHVNVPPHHARLRKPDDSRARLALDPRVVVHWRRARSGSRYLVSAADCLRDMARCQPVGYLLAAGDSALASGLLGRAGLERVADELPLAPAAILRRADRRSGSFAESVFRAGMLQAGIPFQMQVTIGPMRVDFLLGTRLVIEVDGRAFHADDTSFERDRARDAALSVLGYRVLRFSYAQVVHRWSDVEAAIRAALRRGDHH